MRFAKMQGLGNDYIYLNCMNGTPDDLPGLAARLSDRHFGIGGDGLVCICPSAAADCGMRIFNADGSEGEMCGNAIRCVGKYLYDKGMIRRRELSIETLAGVKRLTLLDGEGAESRLTVAMGCPRVEPPMDLEVGGARERVIPVSMGNPHIVVFKDNVKELNLSEIGPLFERHPAFPNRVNTEFVQVISPRQLRMRVWERGSGETLACGTGACAAAAAGIWAGKLEREVTVRLPGGALSVRWEECADSSEMYMTGPAVMVFEGEWPDK